MRTSWAWGCLSFLLESEPILVEVIGSCGTDEYLEAVASGTDDGGVSEPLRKRLGANLRAERHRRALTQEALAEHLGVTARYLAGIERGERNLRKRVHLAWNGEALHVHTGFFAAHRLTPRQVAAADVFTADIVGGKQSVSPR